MERTPLRSSTLASARYNDEGKALEIEFRSGAIYLYKNVPSAFFTALVEGERPGRFYSFHIRDAFEWEQLEPARPAGSAYFGSLPERQD